MKFLLYIILFFPLIISCQSKYNHEPFDEKEKELRKMPDTIKQLMIDSLWQKRDSVSYLRFKNVEMIVLTETDSIPAWITKFSELKVLYASNNRTKIKSIPKDIDKLSKLVQIDLPRNNINVLPPAFFNLKKIERINLSENSLINLSENINKFKNLRVLLVADNNIKEIPISICTLKNLKRLAISNNPITNLPSCLNENLSIESISINGTKFYNFPIKLLDLPNLHEISATNIKLNNYEDIKAICQKKNITFYYDE